MESGIINICDDIELVLETILMSGFYSLDGRGIESIKEIALKVKELQMEYLAERIEAMVKGIEETRFSFDKDYGKAVEEYALIKSYLSIVRARS